MCHSGVFLARERCACRRRSDASFFVFVSIRSGLACLGDWSFLLGAVNRSESSISFIGFIFREADLSGFFFNCVNRLARISSEIDRPIYL